MKNKSNLLFSLLLLVLVAALYREWFFAKEIIGGDWPYVFPDVLKDLSFPPSSWASWQGNGLGGINPVYFLQSFQNFTVSIAYYLGIPWPIIYKIFWFGAFILISAFSSIYLIKKMILNLSMDKALIAGLIFTSNTYILMVVGGGQMGVALSYAIAPFVLARFIKLIDNFLLNENIKYQISNIKYAIIAGLVLSAQVMFDPRIAYLTMIAVVIYLVLSIKRGMFNIFFLLLYSIAIPIGIAILLHAAWIIPLLVTRINPISVLGDAYTGAGIVKFFSFASFSQSFSLLHPNWYENIFGKVGFMKPEFLAIPILAYSSLLFLNKSKVKSQKSKVQVKSQNFNNLTIEQFSNRAILFFALLGLLGAFLAKGANPPFGEIYLWLFENIPGFVMFRDPTKFYVLIALSYSVLIPFGIYSIYSWIKSKVILSVILNSVQDLTGRSRNKFGMTTSLLFLLFTISYLIFLIRPAIFGQLGGTFKHHDVPKEYVELKDFLNSQHQFFRTLWVPRQQRFTFVSNTHPAIEAEPLFGTRNAEELSRKISSKKVQSLLSELSVKYVLIPYDSLGELFLDDRKYSEKHRIEYEKELDAIPWLKKIRSGKIAVYETSLKKDHFFLGKVGEISAIMINPMHYVLAVSIDQPQNLIFSENFSPHWILTKSQKAISSRKTKNGLNSFWLDQKGKYTVDISFNLEKYYEYGRIISFLTIIALTIYMIKLRKK